MSIDLSRARYRMIVNNQPVEAASGDWMDTYNPATGKVLAQVPRGDASDVERAVAAARAAFEGGKWARTSAPRRTRLMMKLADLLWANFDELARLETLNNGKAIASSKGELSQAIGELEFFAGAATKILGHTHSAPHGFLSYSLREPVGVCALIVPWNYPIMLTLRKLAPAIAAGNSAVLKPASATPLTGIVLAELAIEAGFPEGTINVVTGPGAVVGQALAESQRVDKVSFTGETQTGRHIVRAASGNFKRVTLELGGKSPNVVFEDADLEAAVSSSVWSIFYSAGQSCEARSRVLVAHSIYDEFVSAFVAKTQALRVGDPLDEQTHVGALISPAHRNTVEGYVQAGLAEGARLLCGGRPPSGDGLQDGSFYEPTVLGDVGNSMRVAQDEVFGPVAAMIAFQHESDAVQMANDVVYGLAASVWTSDIGRAHRVAAAIRSGVVTINQPFTVFPGTPFGGYKQSGWGREVSLDALNDYTELKSVLVGTGTRPLNPFGLP
jgi:aldehyde dehydrogenase (NAD+)/betaine-aldehyde dehydrogenase